METKFSIDKFPPIFSKMHEKLKIFTFASIKNQISTFTSRKVLWSKVQILRFPMPYRMHFYDIWLWNYLRLNSFVLMFHFSILFWKCLNAILTFLTFWQKSQFFWFFAIFFDNIHKIQNILFLWIHMIILHPTVRSKAETTYFIMPKYLGSKSGNKIFYW